MAATAGICVKTATCETARTGRVVAVPLGDPFACPDCKAALMPPNQATRPPASARVPMATPLIFVGAGLFVLGGAIFVGHEIGQMTAQPAPVVTASALTPMRPAAVALPKPSLPTAGSDAAVPPSIPKLADAAPLIPAVPPGSVSQDSKLAIASGPAVSALPAPALPTLPAPAPVVQAKPMPGPAIAEAAKLPQPAVSAPVQMSVAKPVAPPPAETVANAEPPLLPLPPDQPFSPAPEAGGAPAYPAEMAADGRVGHVAVTCQIQADGMPNGCRAAAKTGGPAFATAALAWLNHGHVRFHPIILHGKPLAATRTWMVTIEEPPALLAEARRKQREAAAALASAEPAPAPTVTPAAVVPHVETVVARQAIPEAPARNAGGNRPFSTHVVSGGAPVFPPYYDEGRPGAVTVSCMISAGGSPSGCHVVRVLGGSGFGKAVLAWLGDGGVRFRPVQEGGQAVDKQETWTVVFNEMPTASYPE